MQSVNDCFDHVKDDYFKLLNKEKILGKSKAEKIKSLKTKKESSTKYRSLSTNVRGTQLIHIPINSSHTKLFGSFSLSVSWDKRKIPIKKLTKIKSKKRPIPDQEEMLSHIRK